MIMEADIALTYLGLKFILLAYLKATLHLTCHVSHGLWDGVALAFLVALMCYSRLPVGKSQT